MNKSRGDRGETDPRNNAKTSKEYIKAKGNYEKYKLTEEEQEILDYFEQDKLLRLPKEELEEQINIAKNAASNFFKKSERINIRLTSHDLTYIKSIAAQKGSPYQTLIASVLHKYAAGYLGLNN